MAAPIIYRWDDPGAPVLIGVEGSLNALLTACLVNGYGDKPAAGWSKEFENIEGSISVFRNDSVVGTGMFLQVDSAWHTSFYFIPRLMAYESMSSYSEGLQAFNEEDPDIFGFFFSGKSNNNTDPIMWVVVADNRGFYAFSYPEADNLDVNNIKSGTYGYRCKGMYFGDIVSILSEDPYGCVFFGGLYASNNYGSTLFELDGGQVTPSFGEPRYLARGISGYRETAPCFIVSGGGPFNYSDAESQRISRGTGLTIIGRPHLTDVTAYSFRGWLPGIYHSCHPVREFDPFELLSIDGKTLLYFWGAKTNQSSIGSLFLDIGETFRP